MRRVLVTGASRGIGRAVAAAFAAEGDVVAVHFVRDRGDAEHTLRLLAGSGHTSVSGDLGVPEEALRVFQEAAAGLGGVDVLVNNAAIAPTPATAHPILGVGFEEWQRVWRRTVDVDLLGATNLTWAFAQHVHSRGATGAVVNVGSRGAFRGEPEHPAYGAAKAGLHSFGQSMAVALAPHGITVATVAPGVVATERQAALLAGPAGDAVRGESPFGRVGTPDEVAAAVLYLASPAAAWASGAVLDLNGASYLRT